jgi:hypothetical protein
MAHNPELTKFEPCDFPVPDEAVEWAKKRRRKKPANKIRFQRCTDCQSPFFLEFIIIKWIYKHKNGVANATLIIKDDCSIYQSFSEDDLPF